MFSGFAIIAIIVQVAIIVAVIVYALKILNRITDIAESQRSIADTQKKMLILMSEKHVQQNK